jgi:hypothetical protein
MSEAANLLPGDRIGVSKSAPTQPRPADRSPSDRCALSLILCSRNDQYQGNSLWRLQTALNYACQQVRDLGREDDVEIIVSDWGSEIPLRDVIALTPEGARLVRFLTIPPEIARIEQKDSPFPEVLALNAAARRASGEYIGRIDQDTLVSRRFFETFFWLREKRRLLVPLESAVMISNRRGIPYRFAARCPSLWVVDRYLRWFGRFLPLTSRPAPHRFYHVFIGILLLHRDIWYECGGFDERFIYMDYMELDMTFRLASTYQVINLGELVDYAFYHLDHERPRVSRHVNRYERKANPIGSLDNMPGELCPSGMDWGLYNHRLDVLPSSSDGQRRGTSRLQARWTAFVAISLLSALQTTPDVSIAYLIKGLRRIRARRRIRWLVGRLGGRRVKRLVARLGPSVRRVSSPQQTSTEETISPKRGDQQ